MMMQIKGLDLEMLWDAARDGNDHVTLALLIASSPVMEGSHQSIIEFLFDVGIRNRELTDLDIKKINTLAKFVEASNV